MRKPISATTNNGSARLRRNTIVRGKLPTLFQRALDDLIQTGKRRALTPSETRILREALAFLDELTILRLERSLSDRR